MKLIGIAMLMAGAAFAQCSGTRHFPASAVSAEVTYTSSPASPSICLAGIAIRTTDESAMVLVVTLKISMSDGSIFAYKQTLDRVAIYGEPTFTLVSLPAGLTPVSIVRFDVTRLHQEPNDTLVY